MAADYECLTLDPSNPGGPRISVVFPASYTLKLYKTAPVRFENLRAARFVLENPQRIFFGVREYNEGGWCYTGCPTEWFIRERIVVPFPPGHVYAVYINPRMRVYECRGERADEADPLSPVDWEKRYRGLVWRSTS